MATPDEIISFWFDHPEVKKGGHAPMWWKKDPEVDAEIQQRFEDDVEKAKAGGYDDWVGTPEGVLALVLLLDQFTRNIYRDSPEAFSGDELALRVSRSAVEQNLDLELPLLQRAFLYMPLEHAEDDAAQEESIAAFKRLVADAADTPYAEAAEGFLEFAHSHKVIIDHYGRYPHRNEILGRESTPEEIEFLKQPNSSF